LLLSVTVAVITGEGVVVTVLVAVAVFVGPTAAPIVGVAVGLTVGLTVGLIVGLAVGLTVGLVVGDVLTGVLVGVGLDFPARWDRLPAALATWESILTSIKDRRNNRRHSIAAMIFARERFLCLYPWWPDSPVLLCMLIYLPRRFIDTCLSIC
jgi:hypothetical protein